MNEQNEINPLTVAERNKLAYEILARLSNFTDSGIRGKREIMVAAELGRFFGRYCLGRPR